MMTSLETNIKRNFSQDSACYDNLDLESKAPSTFMRFNKMKKRYNSKDNASIYSTNTTTSSLSQQSSIASTSSKISKIPNTVKSSMKNFVRRNKAAVSSTSAALTAAPTVDQEKSFASKFRRSTINFGIFRTNKHQEQQQQTIIPTSTTSSSVIPTTTTATTKLNKAKRRNSVVSLASRFLLANSNTTTTATTTCIENNNLNGNFVNENTTNDTNTTTTNTTHTTRLNSIQTNDDCIKEEEEDEEQPDPPLPVGNLLFGKQLEDFDFMASPVTISEHDINITKVVPTSTIQREDTYVGVTDNNSNTSTLLFKGLISSTLTTLYTRLMNECDTTLSDYLYVHANNDLSTSNNTNTSTPIYQQQLKNNLVKEKLLSVISDLFKMIEMVNWDQQEQRKEGFKRMMKQAINTVSSITTTSTSANNTSKKKRTSADNNNVDQEQQLFTLSLVKDTISTVKYIMNQCLSQYYKKVEKAMVIPTKGYKIEGSNTYGGSNAPTSTLTKCDYLNYPIDHKDPDAHWFRTYLYNQEHCTFFGYVTETKEPVMVSIKVEEREAAIATDDSKRQYRLIIRFKNKTPINQRKIIQDSFLLDAPSYNNSNSNNTCFIWKSILEANIPHCNFYQDFRMMDFGQLVSNGLQDDILRLDENSLHTKYKFGVLLVKEGQTREEEWFSNNHDSSEPFEEFLSILGQKVSLYGYTGWAAGLDTKSGDSGDYTYINYWKRQDENDMQQLAFHVSTLIPSRSGDKQQIQRKRHIGNDIVCLVFVEGQQPFNPAAIKSQFLHVFIIVHLEEIATTSHVDGKGKIQNRQIAKAWRVEVVSAENVPSFGPPLPEGALFFDKKELQDFLIAKLVNAEYAAFKSPKFYVPMSRAREGIFTNLVEKGYKLATAPSDGPTAATYSHNDNYPLTTTLSSTASSFSSIASTTTNTMTDKNSFHSFQHKHSKSSSSAITTLSQHSHKSTTIVMPSSSKSSGLLQQFSGKKSYINGGLARRRSIQAISSIGTDKDEMTAPKSSHNTRDSSKKLVGAISSSRRSRSEQDLLNMTSEKSSVKTTAINFKHRILTSIPHFVSYSNGDERTSGNN